MIKNFARILGMSPILGRKDRIISLGGRCEVAYQLRRLTGSDRAFPFDWWITPLRSLPNILREGPAAVFDEKYIRVLPDYDGHPAIYSHLGYSEQKGGTIHLHEFSRSENFLEMPLKDISARLVEKYTALEERIVRAGLEGPVTFVRKFMVGHDPEDPAHLTRLLDEIEPLLREIAPNYELLLLNYCEIPPRKGVIQRNVTVYDDVTEHGSNRGWEELFKELARRRKSKRFGDMSDLLQTLPPLKEDGLA